MMKRLILYILPILGIILTAEGRTSWEPRYNSRPINIFVPHYKAKLGSDRTFMPDQYSCTIRRKLKYCFDSKGRALTGKIVQSDGKTLMYADYINGYQNGETAIYSTDGTLLEKIWYKKGLPDGEAIEYYLNGNIWLIKHYKDGKLNGRVEEYDINGVRVGKMTYKNGWFKDGYCANERSGLTMNDRYKNAKFNQIIPCQQVENDELM